MQKEATTLKYKCTACYNCPCCKNSLIIRASSAQKAAAMAAKTEVKPEKKPEDTTTVPPQKVFYLMCGFCRWTTRDAGIPDATISNFALRLIWD